MMTRVKTPAEIAAMREGGKMLATILQLLKQELQPGMSTKDLSLIAARELEKYGVESPFLGYQGFPDIICISVNDEVVHGIPRPDKIINDGDIVSLDFGIKHKGMITDAAISVIAGTAKQKRHVQLVQRTEQALTAGIMAVHNRVRAGDIAAAVQAELEHAKYGIVEDLVGHGVGHQLHEDPNIPNFGRPNTGPWLDKGMTIAIEPMATLGSERVYVAEDEWTVLTYDGSWAAHFEHSVLITEDGAEILTSL
ncbi:MAG: Methionine aminopeptidase [Candidatus Saccharibacteria bacterium]|nr:Methionine aminopeptidase [Candidatus Saccharibacteria bacterium]